LLAVSLIEPAAIQFHFAGLFCACLGKRSRHNAKLFFSVLVRWMRVAGTILLLGGFLLCVSIVWAAVGFPMIGLGLVCLLIAERRKKQLIAPVVMRSDPVDRRQEPPSLLIEKSAPSAELVEVSPGTIGAQQAPSSFPEPRQPRAPKPALRLRKEQANRQRNEPDTTPYDLEKWRTLVKSDADISRSVEALQPFGKKYVDQLAMAYLAFEEKSYLPTIVKLVANAIKKDSGRDPASVAAMDSDPNTDLISFALSNARTSMVEQVFTSPALNDGFTEKPSSRAPLEVEPDARVKLAVQSGLKTSRSWPEGRAGSTKRQPDVGKVDQGPAVSVVAPARKAMASARDIDDAQDLTDLLNKIA